MTSSRAGLHATLLALALLAAQALGLAHRVAHGLPHASRSAVAAVDATAGSAATEASADSAVTEHAAAPIDAAEVPTAHLSSHDPGGAECRLLDQAAHADALAASAWPALPPRVPAPLPAVAGTVLAGWGVHAYLARGPPTGLRAGPRAA